MERTAEFLSKVEVLPGVTDRHSVPDHFQTVVTRRRNPALVLPQYHRCKINLAVQRRQNQTALPGLTAPLRKLVRVYLIPARNPGNRRALLQRLGNNPRLHRSRPTTTTAPRWQHFNIGENLC